MRDPYAVFPSTVNLWKSMYAKHGLQVPRNEGVEEYVLRTFTHLYERLEEGKKHVRPDRFQELKYEDLVKDPLGEVRRVYERLDLGDFENVRPGLEAYVARSKGYETNKYALAPELRDLVTARWGEVIRRYGYGG